MELLLDHLATHLNRHAKGNAEEALKYKTHLKTKCEQMGDKENGGNGENENEVIKKMEGDKEIGTLKKKIIH